MKSYLVIGYGNSLRSDDGVGQYVANVVSDWHLDSVRSLAVHQLTPELVEDIKEANVVIFVDAVTNSPALGRIEIKQLEANLSDLSAPLTGHCVDPRSLLNLTQLLYGIAPIATQILIPAYDFSLGETLSSETQFHAAIALEKIKTWVTSPPEFRPELSS